MLTHQLQDKRRIVSQLESPKPRLIIIIFTVLSIIFMARATGGFLTGNDARDFSNDGGGEGQAFTVLCAAFYTICVLWLLYQPRVIIRAIKHQKLLSIFIALCVLSSLWSILPMATLVRAVSLLGTISISIYIYFRFDTQIMLRIFCLSFLFMSIGSLIVSVAFPSIGVMHGGENSGNWNGLFSHKSPASYTLMIGVVVCYFGRKTDAYWRVLWTIALVSCFVAFFMTQSRTGFIALFVGSLYGAWLRLKSNSEGNAIAVWDFTAILSIFVVYFAFENIDYFLSAIGRDSNLTGRSDIWAIAVDYLFERPILGYGYQAAWRSNEAMPLQMLKAGWLFNPTHSHNSFIDIALGVGLLGAGIIVFWMIARLFQVASNRASFSDPIMVMFAVIDVCIIITGISGRTIMQPNSFPTVMLIISGLYFSKASLDKETYKKENNYLR